VKKGEERRIWFKLKGVGFTILSTEERDLVLSDFASLLSTAKEGLILAKKTKRHFSYFGYEYDAFIPEFYLMTRNFSDISYFEAEKVDGPKRAKVKRLLNPYTLSLSDGTLARILVAYRFPSNLPEGVLYSLISEASEVAILFKEIEHSRASSLTENVRRRRMAWDHLRVSEEYEANSLEELALRILSGSSFFEFYVLLVIASHNLKDLNSKEKRLRSFLKGYGIEAEPPPIQEQLYSFNVCLGFLCVEKRFSDAESMKPLFFLIDEDLHDEGGVFLGISGTGSPVVLNLWKKPNQNFVIIGSTGSGKSMAAKIFVKRTKEMDEGIPVVGIDPESEYTRAFSKLQVEAVEIKDGEPLGLDPLRLMRDGALGIGQVSDIIGEAYSIPEKLQGTLRKELFLASDLVESIIDFSSVVRDKELSKYLQGASVPPDSYVFQGSPPFLERSVIFGLRNVRSKRLKILISALISSYSINKLLAKAKKSIFFVDEAWLFMETPNIVSLFENLARRGRKHGVAFLYITQRPEDLAKNPSGRAIVEQSSSVFLMRQESQGREAVKEIYRLSESEADFLVNAPIGSGILKSWGKRVTMRIIPTEDELEAFSTNVR